MNVILDHLEIFACQPQRNLSLSFNHSWTLAPEALIIWYTPNHADAHYGAFNLKAQICFFPHGIRLGHPHFFVLFRILHYHICATGALYNSSGAILSSSDCSSITGSSVLASF